MEAFVKTPRLHCLWVFQEGSAVKDVLNRVAKEQGVISQDFYVTTNGRLSDLDDPVHHGAVYHLQPRLRGGKGGFGSMLRALGAQIEKTTNREACRDLSGRRLRDVNHEKEMGDWLKKQAEREAEKEQRRAERLQKKLAEPKHRFSDVQYQQQCYDLSQRVEESVIKGLQASSSGQVKVDDVSTAKRRSSDESEQPLKKKKKEKTAATFYWTGLEGLSSGDEDHDSEEEESPSTSSSSCGAVTMMDHRGDPAESGHSSSSSPAQTRTSEDQNAAETKPSEDLNITAHYKTCEDQEPAERENSEDQNPTMDTTSADVGDPVKTKASADQNPTESKTLADLKPAETRTTEEQNPAESSVEPQQQLVLEVDSATSVQQLEALGMDVLKEELMSRGLKCGGTLSERATRLFSVRGLRSDQIDPALFAKSGKSRKK